MVKIEQTDLSCLYVFVVVVALDSDAVDSVDSETSE